MSKVTLKEMFAQADAEKFCIPAFNYSDIWDFMAIVEAAEEEHALIMLASNPLVTAELGIDMCAAMGSVAMARAKTSVIHHLDHSPSVELCMEAIDLKYPSVMMDASKHPLEENIRQVKEVVEAAHKVGVLVEGEMGRIRGNGIEGKYTGDDFLVNVEDAVKLVEGTNVDSLAVGIGNAHGFYEGKPELNFQRLQEVNEAVKVPLVMHGGTGIPEEDVKKAINLGINKLNVGTIIHCTYMNAMRAELMERGENVYTLDLAEPVRAKIKAEVKKWIRICGCNNKS